MSIATKWPRLLVVGESVTEEQADEILIRTNNWYWIGGNDPAWERNIKTYLRMFGYPEDGENFWREIDAWHQKVGILNLEYLNNSRIYSAYIGGPHGWCNWNGKIGTNSYNIGKWPSTEVVTEEWTVIAEAFPFLTLTAQCVEDEGQGEPAGEWHVNNGEVTYFDGPATLLTSPFDDFENDMQNLFEYGRERGVDPNRLFTALKRVHDKGKSND